MKDKKSLKERFKLFNRHRYEWDVKKERERDRRIIFGIEEWKAYESSYYSIDYNCNFGDSY